MGTVFLHGNGGSGGSGGGMELSVVVDTVRPAKPTYNMIWVNSDVEATSYALTAAEPENPEAGALWISIGDSGKNKVVSPIGDNWITVCPISAKQFIDDAWVDKEAKSYQNGEWVDWWKGQLYECGNQFPFYTGGWESNGNGTMTFEADSMVIGPGSNDKNVRAVTVDKFDLTKYNKLCMEFTSSSASGYPRFGAADRKEPTDSAGWIANVQVGQANSYEQAELDVSKLSGSYYIVISRWDYGTTTVRKVWVE